MSPTKRRLLLVIALLVIFGVSSVVPLEQSVSGPCRVESAATWYLARNGAGQITTGWERNLLSTSGGGLMLQFERPDFVEVHLAPHLRQGEQVEAGDTVAWVESHEGVGRLEVLRAELSRARSELDALMAGARPIDIQVAEHEMERSLAALEIARLEHIRFSTLRDSGFASTSEVEEAYALLSERQAEADHATATVIALREGSRSEDVEVGQAEVRRLESEVATAENLMGGREVVMTPISGRIRLGDAMNDIMLRIERSDTLALLVRLPEASVPLIERDQLMEVVLGADPWAPRQVAIHDILFSTVQEPGAFVVGLIRDEHRILQAGMSGQASCSIGRQTILAGVRARLGTLQF